MSLAPDILHAVTRLNRVAVDLKPLFSRRDTAIDLMRLALLCREHVLLLGPPGTGKSELVNRFARAVSARQFHYLLTRFTEPAELFGAMDVDAFRQGRYRVVTAGMLPEAQVAFLDEVFQSSSAILNTLLTLVNERVYFNGAERQGVPLITLFGASNTLPDDPTLRAFADRFALRVEVEPIPDESLGELFDRGWELELRRLRGEEEESESYLEPAALEPAYRGLARVKVERVQPVYHDLVRRLRAEGVGISDRRLVKGLKFIRGAALLDGREEAGNQDLWPLNHMWGSLEEQRVTQELVQPLVNAAGGPALYRLRPLEELVDELTDLEARTPDGDAALMAHLTSLGQIRRELLLHHVDEAELLRRVHGVIQRQLDNMHSGN